MDTKSFTVTIKRKGWDPLIMECGSTGSALRGICTLEEGGQTYRNNAEITIYGIDADHLKNYSSLALHKGKTVNIPETITVATENKILFSGDSYLTFADFSRFPNISLRISASFGFSAALVKSEQFTIKPDSKLKFTAAANHLAGELNKDLGLYGQPGMITTKFAPEVKSITCPAMTLTGTSLDKLHNLAYALGLHRVIDHTGAYFWVPGKSYPPDFIRQKPEVSVDTGLIRYPMFYNEGISFAVSSIGTWKVGDKIKLSSEVPYADGEYFVIHQHIEMSTLPGGKWETNYNATYAI